MFTLTTVDKLPSAFRRSQKRERVAKTDEWFKTRMKLSDGLKPFEAIVVTFSKEDQERLAIKDVARSFTILLKEFLKDTNLKYDVEKVPVGEGKVAIQISNPGLDAQAPKPKSKKNGVHGVHSPKHEAADADILR